MPFRKFTDDPKISQTEPPSRKKDKDLMHGPKIEVDDTPVK